jgi:hypothetical protein
LIKCAFVRRRRGGDTAADVVVLGLDCAEEGVEAADQQQGDDGNHERVLDRGHAKFTRLLPAEAGSQVRDSRGEVRLHEDRPP